LTFQKDLRIFRYHHFQARRVAMKRQNQISRALVRLLCGLVLLGGCAHKKAYKQAQQYEKSGRYVEAARQDLEALDKKPGYDEALSHLQKMAPFAYQELLSRAETFEANAQWHEAVQSYNELEALLRRFLRYDVVLQTIDISSRLAQAREKGAAHHYENAERYFAAGDYEPAISQYKKVADLAGYYQDTKEKLWQAHVRLGERDLQAQQFQAAVAQFEQALHYAAEIAAVKRRLAEAYYRWAEQFEAGKNFREAMAKFQQAEAAAPNYRDAAERAQQAFEKAVRRVAILPFRNRTQYGSHYAYLLTEELLGECLKADLKFAAFINRANLDQIFEEHKLSQSGALDERQAVEVGKLEGIHSFVTGAITQIFVETSPASFVEKTHERVYTVKDSAGKAIEKREKIYYREYATTRTAQISASYQIVDVETGRYLSGENFSESRDDKAQWIRYQGSIYDLPKDKQKLLDAPGEPKAADLMINDLVREVADKISRKILRFYQ
jgi:tetratricopeptide (TPR) repeat protein